MSYGIPKDWWWLTDPVTGREDKDPVLMDYKEAEICNARLEKHQCRWRWQRRPVEVVEVPTEYQP